MYDYKFIIMKKTYIIIALFVVANLTIASSSDLFKLNYNQVKQDFKQLDQLAEKVKAGNLTYEDLTATDTGLINNLAISSAPSIPLLPDGALGIPSFLWGCILGPLGVIISYITTHDSKEEKKAILGCIVETAVIVTTLIIFLNNFELNFNFPSP